MNRNKIKGISLVVAGNVQGSVARLIGNHQLAYAAHATVFRGRASLAVGDAQDIIKRCLRRAEIGRRSMGRAQA